MYTLVSWISAWNCWSLRALSSLAFLMSAAFRRFAHLVNKSQIFFIKMTFVLFAPQSFWYKRGKWQLRNGLFYIQTGGEAVSTTWLFAKCSTQVKLKTTENKSQWLPERKISIRKLQFPNLASQAYQPVKLQSLLQSNRF